ncbi:aminotransferase class I/II-fold pyridoxal phosphate-dependent enzyme [Pseudomonadales bacterium]|nr:aminotransferase class I/II-fold pyridoxal phosphate-dependent enzyme [Pseudomonadales bacterium]
MAGIFPAVFIVLVYEVFVTNLVAPKVQQQAVSVTRKMSASLPGLREIAAQRGLKVHHLGAGYPHPEVTDPRGFLEHQQAYFDYLAEGEGLNDPTVLPEYLREAYSYTDTLGPVSARQTFANVYGKDWNLTLDPEKLIPTVGASGGINLICSMFEHPGQPVAYITDAPTYAGFTARVALCQHATIFSVEMDGEGPIPEVMRAQIRAAREQGYFVPFYYTVPDGHNPGGFSFTQARREAILQVAREEGILILEDAPYLYINFAKPEDRAKPFFSMAPDQTVHLFTGSKIGFPGPRVGFLYSEAELEIADGKKVPLSDLALVESSSELLFHSPGALRGFEALLHDQDDTGSFVERQSIWPLAEEKLVVYRENRQILLEVFEREFGDHKDQFSWTIPEGGFFTVFTFLNTGAAEPVRTDDAMIERMVMDHGLVVIPMYDFYPLDARKRDPGAGMNQLRLSFCFSESSGQQRRDDMREAVEAFCQAVKLLVGID